MLKRNSKSLAPFAALALLMLLSILSSCTKQDTPTRIDDLQSIRLELQNATAPHQRAEVYEGALAIVVTGKEVLVSKQAQPTSPSSSNSFILEFEDLNKVKNSLGNRIDIKNAILIRDGDGSLYILNTSSGELISFKLESTPDQSNYFKDFDIATNKVFNTSISIATSQRMSADYAESVQTILGEVKLLSSRAENYDDGPAGPYEIKCRCRSGWKSDDDCNSGGHGSSGCSITGTNGAGCSVSGCDGSKYACCGIPASDTDG